MLASNGMSVNTVHWNRFLYAWYRGRNNDPKSKDVIKRVHNDFLGVGKDFKELGHTSNLDDSVNAILPTTLGLSEDLRPIFDLARDTMLRAADKARTEQ